MSNALSDMEFDSILKQQGFTKRSKKLAKVQLIGRMSHPRSERETSKWFHHNLSS
ncbi:MAG: hypothetical protein LBG48_03860 [Rickettsiales bacterium]|jgi:hypothetical protein|nr:hypothetical protein [Rickettsiales bacterium]